MPGDLLFKLDSSDRTVRSEAIVSKASEDGEAQVLDAVELIENRQTLQLLSFFTHTAFPTGSGIAGRNWPRRFSAAPYLFRAIVNSRSIFKSLSLL